MYPVNLIPKSNHEKRTSLILASKQSLSKHSPLTLAPKHSLSKRTSRKPDPKHILDQRPHLTFNPKCTSPKHTPRIFAPKSYLDKRSRLTLTPKRISPKHTSRNLDKKGNRRVRAPELFREFRAASIFAHPTLGRRAFPSFVVCLKWAEVSGLRHGRAA